MKKCVIGIALMFSGCAMWNEYFGPPQKTPEKPKVSSSAKFSDNPNLLVATNRQYKRMTRQRMEEESELDSNAGSMWVMDGQGAYLFAQNKAHKEGDILNVKVEGSAQKEIETKVSVIKKLLQQLEDQEAAERAAKLAAAEAASGDKVPNVDTKANGDKTAATDKNAAARAPAAVPKSADDKKDEPVAIGKVPSRIIEKLPDGTYRIKGQQPFMIGKREYKVLITGLLRSEDYNDDGTSSDKLLDAQYDVLSVRKKATEVTQ